MKGVGKGEVVTSGKLEKSEATVVGFSMSKSTNGAGPVLIGVWSYFGVPVALNDDYVLSWDLGNGRVKLIVELFHYFIIVIRCWGVYLNDGEVVRFCCDPDGYESAGDGGTANDAVSYFLPDDEGNTMLVLCIIS